MTLRELVSRGRDARTQTANTLAVAPLATLQREINRMFDQLWRLRSMAGPHTAAELTDGPRFEPTIEVRESNGEVEVFAELPGLEREEIDVVLSPDGRTLTLHGEKQPEHADRALDFLRSERRYGSFRRAIDLPTAVDTNKAEATYHNGVLEIDLHKLDAGPRSLKRIEIKPG